MKDSDDGRARLEALTGPGAPLNSAAEQLAANGAVEHEFRLRGAAARYRWRDAAALAQQIDGGHPYATRLLVRRPRDNARFNGTVVVEWLNVSTGQDVDFVYGATHELLLREGYAWVGVSAQRVGVETLVRWNLARYAGLSVAAPPDDTETGAPLDPPHAFTGAAGGDVLCWDIFTHAGQAVRRNAFELFGCQRVERVIAAGESQSAFRLSRYFNGLQPVHAAFDGFLLYDRGGPHALRADVAAKVIGMGSEFFAEYAGSPPPDGPNQRWWELAGAGHVSLAEMQAYVDPQVRRDGVHRLHEQPVSLTELMQEQHPAAPGPLWSRVPNGDLMKAALHALCRWIATGAAPASAPRLQLDDEGKLLRDVEGRVMGGVRYAAYEVPTAVNVGSTREAPLLAGYHRDFTHAEWAQRYSSAAVYVERVAAVVAANVAQGYLLQEDGLRVVAQARQLAIEMRIA